MKRLVCSRKRRDSDTILPLSNHYTIPEDFTTIPGPSSQVKTTHKFLCKCKNSVFELTHLAEVRDK